MGYYNPDISRLKWKETRQCWTVSVNIDPGVPVIIDSVNVEITGEGRDNRALNGTVKKIPLHVGDIVHHGKYEQAKKQLQSILTSQGYLEATWLVHKLVVNTETNRARILLGMDTGPRYTFGELSWDPMPLEDDLIQRMLDIPWGGDYNNKSLQYMQRNMLATGYFGRLMLRQKPDRENRSVDIHVEQTPSKRHRFGAGLGYTTDAGVKLSGLYDNRWLNRYGHRWSSSAEGTEIGFSFEGEYIIPGEHPTVEWYSLQSGWQRETPYDDLLSDIIRIRFSHNHERRENWLTSWYLELNHESFTSGEDEGRVTMLVPGISWARAWYGREQPVRKGHSLSYELRAGPWNTAPRNLFLKAEAKIKYLHPIGRKGIGIARLNGGGIWVEDFSLLPVSERFYAGGDDSIRGYAFRSLGPEDDQGDLLGAPYLAVGSLEYEHLVGGNWGVAVFADAGNAFDENNIDIKTGVGAGLRWHTPVGPIKFDLAFPQDDPDQVWRLHFGIGVVL
jgi:translocation and assembly module TamA